MASKITITSSGPAGKIRYTENGQTCEFYWEFSGGDAIATVWFPAEGEWDAKYPWAKGRQKEIVSAVAEEIRRKQSPSSKIEWESDRFHLVKR